MTLFPDMPSGFNLRTFLENVRAEINAELDRLMAHGTIPGRLSDAMRYALMAGGKRLRPVLCVAAARAVGAPDDMPALLRAGCAIECIHTYSLIHDDLPAMDDDALRRGRPTCHVAFDEATAIMAGDALLTLAFEILSHTAESRPVTEHSRWCAVITLIARAAGARGMVEGQMRDMAAEGGGIDTAALEQLHRLKTGALITASVEAGAVLAGADDTACRQLKIYGGHIGAAFQVADDILNVTGDPSVMGKAAGSDAAKNKSTYPALLGLAASREKAAVLLQDALNALGVFGIKADPLRAIARYIVDRDR